MMKKLRYISAMLAAMCLAACQTDDLPDLLQGNDLPEGFYVGDDVPITLGYAFTAEGSSADAATRSKVPGIEDKVRDITLLCFDGNGYFLGKRDLHEADRRTQAELEALNDDQRKELNYFTQEEQDRHDVQGEILYEGKIHIEVPDNTARVHIVTNRNLIMTGEIIGRHVNDVMSSEELSTSMNPSDDTYNDRITFWGYHREYSTEAFFTWLQTEDNLLYLMRDRARVEIGKVLDEKVKSIEWAISSGLSRGYIAPMNRNALNEDPFEGYYTGSGEQAIETVTQLTPYQSERFKAEESNLEPIYWYTDTQEGVTDDDGVAHTKGNVIRRTSAKKYLFEDANNDSSDPVRIILKVTYDASKLENYDTDLVKYHVLMFKDNQDNIRSLYRNRTYVLNLVRLNEDLGETSFADALTTDRFSNDMLNYVQQDVKNVNLGGRLLQVDNTALLIQEGNTLTVNFRYLDGETMQGVSGVEAKDFHLLWTENPYISNDQVNVDLTNPDHAADEPYYEVTYNSTTGYGSVTIGIIEPSTSLKTGKLRLAIDNWASIIEGTDAVNRQLSRVINIYSYQGFSFSGTPTLVDAGETRRWTIDYGDYTQDQSRDVYKFTFKLPDNYPTDLVPLRLRFATSTLNAFADQEVRTNDILQPSGTFSVVTADTNLSGLTGVGVTTDWYYDIDNWGYWYNYEINYISDSREYTIYMCDVRGKRGTSTNQSIGLVYKLEYGDPVQLPFGDPVAVTP